MASQLSDVVGIIDMDSFMVNKTFYCKELGLKKSETQWPNQLLSTLAERSRCLIAMMQSPLPLRSFEHFGPMTLCACVGCVVPRALGESKFMCINTMQPHVWMCTKLH